MSVTSGAPLDGGRILVTGASGMLGSQLLLDAPAGFEAVGTDRAGTVGGPEVLASGYDLTDPAAVEALFDEHGPFDGVLHPAAYTAVDLAEEQRDVAQQVNGDMAGLIAAACAARGIPMVLVSTDFVFAGDGSRPYREDDPPAPQSVYGATKLEGERQALAAHPGGVAIARTQWLYGPRGKHFPGTMLALAEQRDSLNVVHDQVGSPTSTLALSPALWDLLRLGGRGVFHAACEGQASWFEFASATFELAGVSIAVAPCTTDEFPRPAKRPAYSVLDCARLGDLRGTRLAPWRDALSDFLRAEGRLAGS
jgi:dTDP-4-dehydrorhamnose reductase